MKRDFDIMLVEDNQSDAFLFKRALPKKFLDKKIVTATDGVEALRFLFDNDEISTPKVVFLDLKLPRLNGMQVIEKIKSHPKTKSVPVVILTSSGEESDLKKAYELGANSYHVKPIAIEDYKKLISEITEYWLNLNLPHSNH